MRVIPLEAGQMGVFRQPLYRDFQEEVVGMSNSNEEARKILVDATKCFCCWLCVMRCGLRFDKSMNPEAAKVMVKPNYDSRPEISFAEDCDSCGICARHCPSGALAFEGDTGE